MEKYKSFKKHFDIDHSLLRVAERIEVNVQEVFSSINGIVGSNQSRVLHAFTKNRVTEAHLWGSTGYGYNDIGRDTLDSIYAEVFETEHAYVRSQFVSGTHAIASCLLAFLRAGDELILASGTPYDTLHKVIGWKGNSNLSLLANKVKIKNVSLTEDGKLDMEGIMAAINSNTKVVHFQRSRGYSWRRALSSGEIGAVARRIKEEYPNIVTFVDNCYGEFVETVEPTSYGVDLMAGSLIKNPGGGMALWGGYVVGKETLVDQVSEYCTAPGLGAELGGTANIIRTLYHGFFMAPHIVGQALKGAIYAAALLRRLGFETMPQVEEGRYDIIQAIRFNDKEQLVRFCQGIQQASPIDSMAIPEPGELPGYSHQVIMAAGTFVQGGSLELTADAPIVQPYIGYLQGGLTFEHAQIGLLTALNELIKHNLLKVD